MHSSDAYPKRRNDIANTQKGLGKPDAADATLKRYAGEGPNGGPKANSCSTPEAPSVCIRQRSVAGGWEKRGRGLGTLRQRKLNRC